MIGTAWAAGNGAGGGGLFSDPSFWVAVAFVLFFVAAGKILWKGLSGALDKRGADIARALADAERLRDEAVKARADAERTLAQATAEAEGIIGQARTDAERMRDRAAQGLENALKLREQQALDRIAQSEAAAAKEIRDVAVDAAMAATRALLKRDLAAGQAGALVGQAIAELPRRLH